VATFFRKFPSFKSNLEEAERGVLAYLNSPPAVYDYSCCHHSSGAPKALYMGFYEQNLRMSQTRTWKLYEAMDRQLLLSLKELLQLLSETCLRNGTCPYPPPCPQEYRLFGTIFTTIMLNLTSCQWHVDPKNKFAVLLYFGNFTGGSFLLAPPVGLNLLVRRFDVVFIKSSAAFHKAASFTGMRVNLSVYSKTTTAVTKKGSLIVSPEAKWALTP
jgi:hypothetical protein